MAEARKTKAKKTGGKKTNVAPETRVALVTAAPSLLGRGIAIRLAQKVEAVAVHYHLRRKEALKIAEEIRKQGRQARLFEADLSLPGKAKNLVRRVEKAFGRIDVLINNFGPFLDKPWEETTAEEWLNLYRDNVVIALELMKAVLPGMRSRGWGRIVNLGFHRAGQMTSFPRVVAYAAAKTALLLLTRTAAQSEAGHGITVNLVSPGLIEGGEMPRTSELPLEAAVAGKPADVASAINFLVSEEAARVNGVNLVVAGTWKM